MELKEIQFSTHVIAEKWRSHHVYFQPIELNAMVNNVFTEYSKSTMVQELLTFLKKGLILTDGNIIGTGSNETFITISNKDVLFDMEYVTELKPIKLSLNSAIDLFEKYLAYLIRYENGLIPGLIPEEKLNEWRIVPIYQIKEEFQYKPTRYKKE